MYSILFEFLADARHHYPHTACNLIVGYRVSERLTSGGTKYLAGQHHHPHVLLQQGKNAVFRMTEEIDSPSFAIGFLS